MQSTLTRRRLIATGVATLAAPALAPSLAGAEIVTHNASSFVAQDWREHFAALGVATLLADTTSRALHYWSADGSDYRIYPTSVPRTDELTRRGLTSVVRKKVGPGLDAHAVDGRRESRPASHGPRPRQSARHPRALSRLAGLPDPRHA